MSFLIAHIVHGKPEFCIADPIEGGTESDPGPWWIVGGGWRAFPYWTCPLRELLMLVNNNPVPLFLPEAPPDWPDFFKKESPRPMKLRRGSTKINLEELGL